MRRSRTYHKDPYRIHDVNNIFEVFFNSSHPELKEKKRILDYKGRVFRTEGEALSFFDSEGIDWRRLHLVPVRENRDGEDFIRGNLCERKPETYGDLQAILRGNGRTG